MRISPLLPAAACGVLLCGAWAGGGVLWTGPTDSPCGGAAAGAPWPGDAAALLPGSSAQGIGLAGKSRTAIAAAEGERRPADPLAGTPVQGPLAGAPVQGTLADSLATVPAEPPAAAPEPIPSSAAEGIARRYFHALVVFEELQAALTPEEQQDASHAERYPGLEAARRELQFRNDELSRVEPPRAGESLPLVDLRARDGDFERIYGPMSREDRLMEQWRLARFAYPESRRLLEAQLDGKLYESNIPAQPRAFG